MATATDIRTRPATGGALEFPSEAIAERGTHGLPAGAAATRVARIGMALSAFGLGTSALTIVALLSTWRIGTGAHLHEISIAGQRIAYPAANVEAVIVLLLAGAGLGVAVKVLGGACGALLATRRLTRTLAAVGVGELGGAIVIDDPQPHAFCAGLLRPIVYVTSGAVTLLDADALDVVLLHEHHHARRRDPLRLAAGRTIARALFFLPWLGALHRHELSLAELGADESAVSARPENRSALARAMLSFTDTAAGHGGVDPLRVDYLLGENPSWRVPASLCIAPLLTTGLIATLLILVRHLAAGTATLALPFFSSRPCIVMLALIPAAAGRIIQCRKGAGDHARLRRPSSRTS